MGSPQPTVQPPLSNVYVVPFGRYSYNAWIQATLSGVPTPGTIARDGMRGFERKTGWDIKKGKGVQGATLTLKDAPPVVGSVTLQLVTAQDFSDYDDFVEQVLSLSPTAQSANGLSWYYPEHSAIGLTTVVVQHYTGPKNKGGGMYHATFELLEWSPPPAVSIVKTVAATSPDNPESVVAPKPQDPRIAAREAQIAALQGAYYDNGSGGGSSF